MTCRNSSCPGKAKLCQAVHAESWQYRCTREKVRGRREYFEAAARCRTSASEAASRPSVVVGEKIWWGVGALFAIELALVSAVDG